MMPLEATILSNDLTVSTAEIANKQDLNEFYGQMYGDRKRLPQIWKWLYHDSFPLVLLNNKRVVGHAGRIPFQIQLGKQTFQASWYVDFAILPAFQRKGLGIHLTEKWMEYADVYVTFCNDQSIGVFKKFGWVESFNTYLHFLPILPFNHRKLSQYLPSFLRKTLNILPSVYYKYLYKKRSQGLNDFLIEAINSENIKQFILECSSDGDVIQPLRDQDYFSWRLLSSPDREQYFIVRRSDRSKGQMVIKLFETVNLKYIDVLCVSQSHTYKDLSSLMAQLGLWGMREKFSYIRLLTLDEKYSKRLKDDFKSFVSSHRFAYFSKNHDILETFKSLPWHFELIDSDWEEF